MLLLFLSSETAAGTGGQNLGVTAGTAKSLQGNRGKAFFHLWNFLIGSHIGMCATETATVQH